MRGKIEAPTCWCSLSREPDPLALDPAGAETSNPSGFCSTYAGCRTGTPSGRRQAGRSERCSASCLSVSPFGTFTPTLACPHASHPHTVTQCSGTLSNFLDDLCVCIYSETEQFHRIKYSINTRDMLVFFFPCWYFDLIATCEVCELVLFYYNLLLLVVFMFLHFWVS